MRGGHGLSCQTRLYVFLGCTRAYVCRCDGNVICVGYDDLTGVLGGGKSAV